MFKFKEKNYAKNQTVYFFSSRPLTAQYLVTGSELLTARALDVDVIEFDSDSVKSRQSNPMGRRLLMTPQAAEFVVNTYTQAVNPHPK